MTVELICGDCLDVLPTLAAGSVDAVITDLPYGTTQCAWDSIIPLETMWAQVARVMQPKGIFVTTAAQPFTSALVMSNLDWFRQELIWDKVLPVGFLDAKRKHMRAHENIVLFAPAGRPTYNPQMTRRGPIRQKGSLKSKKASPVYGAYTQQISHSNTYYPTSIVTFSNGDHTREDVGDHPTQKPVPLMVYLVNTFTNPGDTVLDLAMGSGTTGVACCKLGRNFVGVELSPGYFAIAQRRIAAAQAQLVLPLFAQVSP